MKKVFLLEDVEPNAVLIACFLELSGWDQLERATTLREAERHIDAADMADYAAWIIDIELPDGESYGILDMLKARQARNIFAYTVRCSPSEVVWLQARGFDHVYPKPLRLGAFAEHFEHAVEAA
ncbi:MAG: hypothetical protein AAF074_16360 [Pseudomonadota bacterium]